MINYLFFRGVWRRKTHFRFYMQMLNMQCYTSCPAHLVVFNIIVPRQVEIFCTLHAQMVLKQGNALDGSNVF